MLKKYMIAGKEWQFIEGEQPDGAVEVGKKAVDPPKNKAKKPANKRRAVKKK